MEIGLGFPKLLVLGSAHQLFIHAFETGKRFRLSAVVVSLLQGNKSEQVEGVGVLGIRFDGFLQFLDSGFLSVVRKVTDGKLVAHLRLIGIPFGTRSAPGSRQHRDAGTHCE